jgi:hypothetical protein
MVISSFEWNFYTFIWPNLQEQLRALSSSTSIYKSLHIVVRFFKRLHCWNVMSITSYQTYRIIELATALFGIFVTPYMFHFFHAGWRRRNRTWTSYPELEILVLQWLWVWLLFYMHVLHDICHNHFKWANFIYFFKVLCMHATPSTTPKIGLFHGINCYMISL